MNRQETAAVLRRAREGSDEALRALYDRYAGKLLALIRLRMGRKLRAVMESRDILQSCLLKSFERIEQFESSDSASWMAWLARIAEHEIRDQFEFHRRQRRDFEANVELDEAVGGLASRVRSSLSRLVVDEQSRRLETMLEKLPDSYREVILLRKLEERPWSDVARRLGRSPDACRMLMARAMTALTLAMDEAK